MRDLGDFLALVFCLGGVVLCAVILHAVTGW